MTAAVRPMHEGDVGAVVAMAAETPSAPHWPEFEFRRMLRAGAESPSRRGAWVSLDGSGEVSGFAMASRVAEVAELEAVVAAPGFRRMGIGSALTRAAIDWSRDAGAARVVLEARAANGPALAMYARLGFTQDGKRRGYYRNPDEDAVLFSFKL